MNTDVKSAVSSILVNFFKFISLMFYFLFSVTDLDVRKAIKRIKPSNSVGLHGIAYFIIKSSIVVFAPLIKYIVNRTFSYQLLPSP